MLLLDDEDYALLSNSSVDAFDAAFALESRIAEWREIRRNTPRSRKSEKTVVGRLFAAARARKSYDKHRKPRVRLGGTWQERNPEQYREAHQKAALAYYYRNRERIRAQQAEYRKRRKERGT